MISCRDVWKLYGPEPTKFLKRHNGHPTIQAVKDAGYIPAVVAATLDVAPGEILVLMGLSGSGKSTLVRCLSRLIEPTSGSVQFGGIDLLAASNRELINIRRHRMGMVFQHFALFPNRTVAENIVFPLEVQGVDSNTRRARAEEIIYLVGLEGRGEYYPRELSGGQQQRVGIGRSLAVEPDVWFLDEPFSALDPLIRREMQDEFLSGVGHCTRHRFHYPDSAKRVVSRSNCHLLKADRPGRSRETNHRPATDYVRRSPKSYNETKFARSQHYGKIDEADPNGVSVHREDILSDVAAAVLRSQTPLAVRDNTGTAIGSLDRDTLIQAVWGPDTADADADTDTN